MQRSRKQLSLTIGAAILACTTWAESSMALDLIVDPISGNVSLANQSYATSVTLDGYTISSASGQLVPDPTHTPGVGWDSLSSAGLPGWQEVAPTATALSELNLTSSTTLGGGGVLNLGKAFTPNGTKDVTWGYSAPGGITTLPASILYTNAFQVQIIELLGPGHVVQGSAAVMYNGTAAPVTLDGYIIQSAGGGLNSTGLTGFSGHTVPGWQSVAPSTTALTELNLTSSSTLAAGHDEALGAIYTVGGAQDVTFQYKDTTAGVLGGTLFYKSVLQGDATGDGFVNGLDISAIAGNWLQSGILTGDVNYDGFVNGLDITTIAGHWLNALGGSGTGADLGNPTGVPEPSGFVLAAIGMLAGCRFACRRVRHAVP